MADNDQMVTISLDELDKRIQADLMNANKLRKMEETTRERVEGYVYLFCLILGAVFIVLHMLTDWIPYLVGLPSARVILTQWL